MATEFKMPQLGETVVEGTITRWLKQEGDAVEVDEALVEVSTDKVDSEIPAPTAGVLVKIHAQEGETVSVGDVIAEIGGEGEAAGQETEAPKVEEPKAEPEKEKPTAEKETKKEEEKPAAKAPEEKKEAPPPQPPKVEPDGRKAAAAGGDGSAAPKPQELESTEEEPRRGILSPLVRKLAAEHGVDLRQVRGSGTGGRITKQDILKSVESGTARPAAERPAEKPAAHEAAPAAQPRPGVAAGAREEVVQISNMRKSIAEHMVASLHETARAWNTVEVDMTNIGRLRHAAGAAFEKNEGFSLTWMPFLSKAVVQTLLKHPNVNSTWNGDGTITMKHYVNLGIAVALENGLIVPVIKGADGMNIAGLARSIRDIADRARTKKLVPDDVQGGTFTITNPGPFGSILSVPIINKGQAAILAFDSVVKRPVVVTDENGEDSIAIRQMVFLSLSWDHRVIDGAESSLFLKDLKELLERADFEGDLTPYLPEQK